MSTIFALSSGRGRAGIAVLRVSGPGAGGALRTLAGKVPVPRAATVARLGYTTKGSVVLDHAMVLWFPGPASATGEDVAEFHVHGGPAVVAAVLGALASLPGLRAAEAGEFARRAFANGKLDLTQAEALADTIEAETEAQRIQSLRQLDGELGRTLERWREEILRGLAHVEAAIDFAEDDLPAGAVAAAAARVHRLAPEMDEFLADSRRGERLRDGVHAVLLGAPNVGKSSLLNRLARRDAAIVSATAGTTRDIVEAHLDLGGYPLVVADTAGLREDAGEIEGEGVRRALARAEAADLKLALFDGEAWPETDPRTRSLVDDDTVVVVNKSDRIPGGLPAGGEIGGRPVWFVSALTGEGLDGLLGAVEAELAGKAGLGEAAGLTRARHRDSVEECVFSLRRFLDRGSEGADLELAAEDLRMAARALGRITGRVDVEDVLDRIFADFCIGK